MSIDTTPEGLSIGANLQSKPNVLADIYRLVAEAKTDEAMDRLFEVVDDLLSSGNFAGCESMLQNVDLGRVDVDVMIGFLSITLAGKSRMPARADLLRRVEERLRAAVPADQVAGLLNGLK